jgi:electron transfer flavoprotein beta subunit
LLIIVLMKGVPARTTQVAQVGGVLNREAMDLVLNPHDAKAVEAADYIKRKVGGKSVALTMGPDMKLIPLMKPLYDAEVTGVDEEYVLSDRKMAGSDTLATSYAVSLGVKKLVERHTAPLDMLSELVKKAGYSEAVKARAQELYDSNLIPNRVYSDLPAVKETIVGRFESGAATASETVAALEAVKQSVARFVIVSGIKTTDGETGSVGPQVAEGVSALMGRVLPHATYVEDFDVDEQGTTLTTRRVIGTLHQTLEMELPSLITVSTEYRPRVAEASLKPDARLNLFKGKVTQATKWTAEDLGADVSRLGLSGSPTIVGAGVDVGKPPVQKVVGKSMVFLEDVASVESEGKKLGPFSKGDLADGLPDGALHDLKSAGKVGVFGIATLAGELFA